MELKAILKAIQGYHLYWQGRKHIRIKSDNTTAIAYVNNMGGTVSQKCNNLSKFIWEFCTGQGVWISAEHIPGSKNNIADHMSRKFNENTEWQLDQHIFIKLLKYFSVKPSIDLFASDLNKQLTKYCSWQPDPKAFGIDAFNMTWTDYIFYAFPPFSLVGKSISKIIREKATGLMIIPWWPTQKLVSTDDSAPSGLSGCATIKTVDTEITKMCNKNNTPSVSQIKTTGRTFVRESMGNRGIPEEIMDIICESWRENTSTRYGGVLKKWKLHCSQRHADPYHTDVKNVLEFLHGMYLNGCRYSGICAARSALASAVTIPGYEKLSSHPLISRYIKGIFNKHPPLPKYVKIWDINCLLTYYEKLGDNKELSFKELCKKVATLFMILGARRKQALMTIDVSNIVFENKKVVLLPNKTLKHTNPNHPLKPFEYSSFEANPKLCIVNCLQFYIGERNTRFRDSGKLMVTHGKPHKEASNDTVSRWIKEDMINAGIDISTFQAHSCRAASTSKAKNLGIPLSEILKRGCWSRDSTFKKFYDKDVITGSSIDEEDYTTTLLHSHTSTE